MYCITYVLLCWCTLDFHRAFDLLRSWIHPHRRIAHVVLAAHRLRLQLHVATAFTTCFGMHSFVWYLYPTVYHHSCNTAGYLLMQSLQPFSDTQHIWRSCCNWCCNLTNKLFNGCLQILLLNFEQLANRFHQHRRRRDTCHRVAVMQATGEAMVSFVELMYVICNLGAVYYDHGSSTTSVALAARASRSKMLIPHAMFLLSNVLSSIKWISRFLEPAKTVHSSTALWNCVRRNWSSNQPNQTYVFQDQTHQICINSTDIE